MTSIKARDRQKVILEYVHANGRVEINDIARILNVTSVTVRSDLQALERSQMLRRIRGGALSSRPSRSDQSIENGFKELGAEKESIAAVAASLVRDNETVIMDTGSTTAAVARALPKSLRNVAVITNSLSIVLELKLHPGITVIVTGGTLRPQLNSLVSSLGQLLFREINADLAFMSCWGVDVVKGFTNGNLEEAEMKKSMVGASRRVVFVADHSKLNQVAAARIADLSEAGLLITSFGAPPEVVRRLRDASLKVQVAAALD